MNTRAAMMIGLSAMAFSVAAAGTLHGGAAFAGARDESRDEKAALENARKAQALVASGKPDAAIGFAEQAVSLRPQISDYRIILGQAYLKSGRFVSARDAFGDVVTLEPDNGKAALNLSLAQIATGDWDGARKTLDAHSGTIAPSDRGLAMALAGDPAGAVGVLTDVVRAPGADAKARQNLALALALAGRWTEAKTMVAFDVAPEQVEPRIAQWAVFAKPHAAYDQVASLLGVRAVEDHGQPVALALNAPAPMSVAKAEPVNAVEPAAVPVAETATTVPAAEVAVAAIPSVGVQFGPRQEIVQPLPLQPARAVPVRQAVAAPTHAISPIKPVVAMKAAAKGSFYVQLGAYDNPAIARSAWTHAAPHFAGHMPSGMKFATKAGSFYRLSVGSFARADADAMCGSYRAAGGACFVRIGAGDKVASWSPANKQLASR
jgi:Flp pilus assembly protein TadD